MVIFSAVCIFCEDIREEKSGQDTIVGTFPDNLVVEGAPPPIPNSKGIMPKLGIYLRVNVNTDGDKPSNISAKVLGSSGDIIAQSGWAPDLIDHSFEDAKRNQLPIYGLLLKLVAAPVPIANGKITVIVTVDGVECLAGALNVILPSASAQPASQSPSAS